MKWVPDTTAYDETFDRAAAARPHYRPLVATLESFTQAEIDRRERLQKISLVDQGITFTVYGEKDGIERIFPFDFVPRIIPAREWERIEAGLIQRVIALLGPGDFFGEGCLAGQPLRMATAAALTDCAIVRLAKPAMVQALHREAVFAETFTTHLLSRNIRMEEDLVDQLFNSSEKRLARILLLLANFGKEGRPEPVVPKISQEMLAEMVGTTRSRISFFMNKFRKLGFVHYNGGLQVHSALLHVVLHD